MSLEDLKDQMRSILEQCEKPIETNDENMSEDEYIDNPSRLDEECLTEVIENFDSYVDGYKAPHGPAAARQFEFLQRAYSETIFYELKDELEERHLDFLVNPYLKHLDIRRFGKQLIWLIGSKLKTNGNGIISIKAMFSKILSRHLIPTSSCLEVLEIGGFRNTRASSIHSIYTTEMIKTLGSHCPALRILKLRGDEDLSSRQCVDFFQRKLCPEVYEAVCSLLDNCPSLEVLENVDAVGVLYQKHKLDFQNNGLERQRKYSLTNLTFFDGSNYPLDDAFKICYALCPNVSRVQLLCVSSNKQLLRCTDFPLLDDVRIVAEDITVDGMNQFLMSKGSQLVNLELLDTCVSAQTIVKCCPALKSLRLSNISHYQPLNLNGKDLSLSLAVLPNLKSLTVDQTDFAHKKVADSFKLILSAAKNLEIVTFHEIYGLNQDFCTIISELGLNRIHELNVVTSDITVPALTNLLSQGNLQKLNVRYCRNIYRDDYYTFLQYIKNSENLEVRCFSDSEFCWGDWRDDNFVYHSPKEWEFSDQSISGSDYDSDLNYDSDDTREEYFNDIFGKDSLYML